MKSLRQSHAVLLPLALLALALGCATRPSVLASRDDAADFSRYRSWSWQLAARDDERSPLEVDRELSARVQERIHREFAERGFQYHRGDADLVVAARLTVARQRHIIERNTATQSLHSFHFTPSYEIHAARAEVVNYERGRLVIRVLDRRTGREVWRGEYAARFDDAFAHHVKEAVASTLESFPAVASGGPTFDSGRIARNR